MKTMSEHGVRIHDVKATCEWSVGVPTVTVCTHFTAAGADRPMTAVHVTDGDGDKLFHIYNGFLSVADLSGHTPLAKYPNRESACTSEYRKTFNFLISLGDSVYEAM